MLINDVFLIYKIKKQYFDNKFILKDIEWSIKIIIENNKKLNLIFLY
jgi:hypothetical protein